MKQKIRYLFYQIHGIIVSWLPRRIKKSYGLVIIRFDALGDYVMWHDAISAYKERYKGKKVLLICPNIISKLAEREKFFDEILEFDKSAIENRCKYYLDFIRCVKSIGTEDLIFPVPERQRMGDIFSLIIKAKTKASIELKSKESLIGRYFSSHYSNLIHLPKGMEHEILITEFFTQKIIYDKYRYGTYPIVVDTKDFGILGQYVVVSLSASNDLRVWPMERFASVLDSIPAKYSIVLTGVGAKDMERAKTVIYNLKTKERVINMTNMTSVPDLVSLISRSLFVIGNDSSAVHIAAGIHVPSLCILPGAHFGRFLPYPDSFGENPYKPRVVYNKMDCYGCGYLCNKPIVDGCYMCLSKITPEMVKKEVFSILDHLILN